MQLRILTVLFVAFLAFSVAACSQAEEEVTEGANCTCEQGINGQNCWC